MRIAAEIKAAMRFWEPARIPYNLLLASAALITLPSGAISQGTVPLAILAVVANLLYFAAYPVDLILQFGSTRTRRLSLTPMRWLVWILGTATALFFTLAVCAFVSFDMSD